MKMIHGGTHCSSPHIDQPPRKIVAAKAEAANA